MPPLIVFVLAIAVYVPSLDNGFVSWDDDHYIYNNRQLVHPDGLNDIWTNTKTTKFEALKNSTHQYYPLLFTMFWVEHQIYHHLTDELLFSLPAERTSDLKPGKLTPELEKEFSSREIDIPRKSRVHVVEPDRRWLIAPIKGKGFHDPEARTPREGFGVRLEDGRLNVYSSDPAIFEEAGEAWVHHSVCAVLHAITAVIMLLLLQRLGVNVWVAWVVAALFAVHPMNVATVAWATERKNILSLLFYMLAVMCYLRHRRTGSWLVYLGTFIFFQAALFSKTVALTLPFVLFLTDFLLDRRWSLGRLMLRGAPLLVIAIIALLPTLTMKDGWDWRHTLGIILPMVVCGIGAAFADQQLSRRLSVKSFFGLVPTAVMFVVALGATLLLGERWDAGAIAVRFAPLWVIVALIFVIDRVSGGRLDIQSLLRLAPLLVMLVLSADTTMHMEDRARTVPLEGFGQRPFVAAASVWWYVLKLIVPIFQLPINELWNPFPFDHTRWRPGGEAIWWVPVFGVLLAGWALFRWRKKLPPLFYWGLGFYLVTQLPMMGWKNINFFQFAFVAEHYAYNASIGVFLMFAVSLDLLRRWLGGSRGTLIVTGVVCAALAAYGAKTVVYSETWKSAETFWLTTLEGNPRCWAGWYNLGNKYRRAVTTSNEEGKREDAKRQRQKAIEFYKKAIEHHPRLTLAYRQLISLLVNEKRYPEAREYCDKVQPIMPYLAYLYRGVMDEREKQWEDGAKQYKQAARWATTIDERKDVMRGAGRCLKWAQQWQEAVEIYQQLLELQPKGSFVIHYSLGFCYYHMAELKPAEVEFRKALKFRPNDAKTRKYLELVENRSVPRP